MLAAMTARNAAAIVMMTRLPTGAESGMRVRLRASPGTREGMDIAKLALRGVVGGLFVGHGTQKLFGWFGGHGPDGTGQFFENLGLRPGKRNAIAAGAAEAGGGALLALGAATPLAATAVASTMVTAIRKVHAPKGPWVSEGGWEYNAVLITAMAVLAESGPGPPPRRPPPLPNRPGPPRAPPHARRRHRRLLPHRPPLRARPRGHRLCRRPGRHGRSRRAGALRAG